ncbi:NAD(P)H-dependent flavin oxidoreductase [Roseomonas sp. CCTCC AB2023176]|uniref:NAD(P)H-dependent flavin oxidoreductase n=1 Tax=Roseomonas sp. CCTCC AB2023176 TaxID=3342640 RepID=UPI0035D5C8D6
MPTPKQRAEAFCERFGLRVPVVMGPMASASPPALAAAVANAGGLGSLGALQMGPVAIADWAGTFRSRSNGAFQVNTWIPDPAPPRDPVQEERMRGLLAAHGADMGDLDGPGLPDFGAQLEAILAAGPNVVSSIMGLYPPDFVEACRARGIAWFANVSCLEEARAAETAGADAVVVSGAEAGGHRGAFEAEEAASRTGTTFALVPQVADAVRVPVIAAGGIADGRGLAAALALGAAAVQVGTALLRTPEAGIAPPWAEAIGRTRPEDTVMTRAFSGRFARAVRSAWTEAVGDDALPYPLQRMATGPMRDAALRAGDAEHLQMWAGQGARLARAEPAGEVVRRMWDDARAILA